MFYMGIDIAKFKHDFCIIDGDTGEIIVPPRTITNDKEGFQEMLEILAKLHCSQRLVRVFGPHRLHAAFQLGDKRGATRVRKQRALFEKQSDAIRTGIEPDTNREQGGIRLFDNSQRERVLTPPNQVIRNIQQLDLVLQRKDIAVHKEGV